MKLELFRTRGRREPFVRFDTLIAASAGVALGATAAVLLDPRAGARRRGQVRQKAMHAGKVAESFGEKAVRDLEHRSRGFLASLSSSMRSEEPSPEILVERVRARLGRLTSHPSAIEVAVRDGGVVEVRGPVLGQEANRVIRGLARVRGVREVMDRLERHDRADGISRLEGGARPPRLAPEFMQRHWTPGIRALGLACGTALGVWGLRRRGALGTSAGGLGILLAGRAATNREMARILG
jgi:hypothetical protein